MVIAFTWAKPVRQASAREVRSVIAASLAATALDSVAHFRIDRLDYIPRSLPVIQLLVLCRSCWEAARSRRADVDLQRSTRQQLFVGLAHATR